MVTVAHLRIRTGTMYTQKPHLFLTEELVQKNGTGILEEDRQETDISGGREMKGRWYASNAG